MTWEEDPEVIVGLACTALFCVGTCLAGAAKYKEARSQAKSQEFRDQTYAREIARRERMTYR